ncbi:TPA: hypothetical protein QB234_000758 [Pasteurella multocida]|nr:hypothetical protein [Pasteurella multocida]HDR1911519.1 hypothetical protein [Pasteurella multocida]
MCGKTKNSALITALAFHYQVLVGLDKCFKLKEGESIFFEKDGDVSLVGQNDSSSLQMEIKNYSDSLTDNHLNFWKTLKNWLQPEFNQAKYGYLILHTTQPFGVSSTLKNWNTIDIEERLELIRKICSKNESSTSEVANIQKEIISSDEQLLRKILGKIYLYTIADNGDELIEKIKRELKGIPDNNLSCYLNALVGYLYGESKSACWEIKYERFKEILIHITSTYAQKTFTFPNFTGQSASEDEIDKNKTKLFVTKILDIDYEDVLPEAIGNWLEVVNSLMLDLDNSPIYQNMTNDYQRQLISMFKSRFSTASRNKHNPKDLYDEVIGTPPSSMKDQGTPHLAYKNGLLHHAMDDSLQGLKWDCLK